MTKTIAIEQDYKTQPDCTDLGHIPGNWGLPIIGHMLPWVKDMRGMLEKHARQYGPVSKVNIMGNKGVMVTGPDIMQEALLDKDRNFSNEMAYQNTIGKFFEGGILLKDFDDHKIQRRIFQNAFKNEPMRTYVGYMNDIMGSDMDSWNAINNFVLFPHIKKTLLTTAAKIFAGVDPGTPNFYRLYKDYVDMLEGITSLVQIEIPGSKWAKAQQAKRDIFNCFKTLIPERRAKHETDFLTFFSQETKEDGSQFTDDEIVRHMNFLLFAAHDTTTASIINVCYELAKNPAWQERIRQSCQAFKAEAGKEALTYDDLDSIPDLENAMLEGQRLHPSVPWAARRTIREMTIEGYKIPAHTLLWLPYFSSNRSDKFWTNPDQFDPDRFSPGRDEHKKHSFQFIPFGGGAHKCIGMHFAKIQVKCFFYQFLQRYKFSVPENYNPWLMMVPMPKPVDGLPLKLERIDGH
jgi:cytochrome P450